MLIGPEMFFGDTSPVTMRHSIVTVSHDLSQVRSGARGRLDADATDAATVDSMFLDADRELNGTPLAHDLDRYLAVHPRLHQRHQVAEITDGLAIDGDDFIAGPQTGSGGRAVIDDAAYDRRQVRQPELEAESGHQRAGFG